MKIVPFLFILFLLSSCMTKEGDIPVESEPEGVTISHGLEEVSLEEFAVLMEPYMARDSQISMNAPVPGVPSPAEALKDIVIDVLEDYTKNPFCTESMVYKAFGKEFLERVRIEEPLLFFKYIDYEFFQKSCSYLIIAAHPVYGKVSLCRYSFYEKESGYAPGVYEYSFGSPVSQGASLITQKQAREYFEYILEVTLERDPITVWLPDKGHYFYGRQDFAWYCLVPNRGNPRAIEEGDYQEYILSPWTPYIAAKVLDGAHPSGWKMDREEMERRIKRINEKLNIYGIIDFRNGKETNYTVGEEYRTFHERIELQPY
ncbi:MAG: hypothetical protein PQJ59_08435 [Spirochaetales bacterium]|nr:hypothetical protein [Spirochaetales bacterium]